MPAIKVLALSTSSVSYQETDGSPSLLALLHDLLATQRPEFDWQFSSELLYTTSTMAARAIRLVERNEPDIVLLRPTSRLFMHDDVASRVKLRWPRLHAAAIRIARFFDDVSGGPQLNPTYKRRFLFSAPRWLAVRLIGVAPPLTVEEATANVIEAVDALVANESIEVLVRMSAGNTESNVPSPERERRIDYFRGRIREHCSRRHVPCGDNADIVRQLGGEYGYAPDGVHPGVEHRVLEAQAIAADILALARVSEGLQPARTVR